MEKWNEILKSHLLKGPKNETGHSNDIDGKIYSSNMG